MTDLKQELFWAACRGDSVAQSALADVLEGEGWNDVLAFTRGLVDYARWQTTKMPTACPDVVGLPTSFVRQVRQTVLAERLTGALQRFARLITVEPGTPGPTRWSRGKQGKEYGQVQLTLDFPSYRSPLLDGTQVAINQSGYWDRQLKKPSTIYVCFNCRVLFGSYAVGGPNLSWRSNKGQDYWDKMGIVWSDIFVRQETDPVWAQHHREWVALQNEVARGLLAHIPTLEE